MSNQKNQAFLRDPLQFIQQNAVDIRTFDRSISGRPSWMGALDEDVWFGMYGGAVCAVIREAYFDLEPYYSGSLFSRNHFCVLRFDRQSVTQQFLAAIQALKQVNAQKAFDTLQQRKQAFALNPLLPANQTVVATQPAVQLGRGSGPYLAPAPANLFASRP